MPSRSQRPQTTRRSGVDRGLLRLSRSRVHVRGRASISAPGCGLALSHPVSAQVVLVNARGEIASELSLENVNSVSPTTLAGTQSPGNRARVFARGVVINCRSGAWPHEDNHGSTATAKATITPTILA